MKPSFPVDRYFRQCVGIDVSKNKFTACLCMYGLGCTADSSVPIDFTNNKTGFNQLVKWARREAVKEKPIYFLMEPTGTYYEDLAVHLSKLSFTIFVIPGNRVKAFFKEIGIKTKTDGVDAYGLAFMGASKPYLTPWTPPNPTYRELRQLTRMHVQFQDIITILKNQREALTHSYEPSHEAIKHLDSLLRSANKKLDDNIAAIKVLAASDKEIAEKINYVSSIKGIGDLTAAILLAETNGFQMFNSRKQVASFAGLDVVARQSGTINPPRRISKQGNKYIRRALFMCAMTASCRNPHMRSFYLRLIGTKRSGAAYTAIMRKLLLLAFTLCKNKKLYDPKYNLES